MEVGPVTESVLDDSPTCVDGDVHGPTDGDSVGVTRPSGRPDPPVPVTVGPHS